MIVPKITEEPPHITDHKIDQNRLASVGTDFALLAMCFLAAFVSFWDVGFSINKAFTVGWLSVLIFIVSTTTYRNKYDGGIYKGRQTKEYISAKATFEGIRDHIVANSLITTLSDWCNDYRVNDMERLQKSIVCPYMTFEEYTTKYKNISKRKVFRCDLSWQAKKAVFLANAISPIELSAESLLGISSQTNLFGKRRALPISGGEKRKRDMIVNYASKFILTFVLGMFVIEILSDPTLETFLQWLIRMFPVVTAYLTGEVNGYRNVTNVDTHRINAQSQILKLFFADEKMDLPKQGQKNDLQKVSGDGAYGS